MTAEQMEITAPENDSKGLLGKRLQLSTPFNQLIIGLAVFFWAAALTGAGSIAFLKYLEWGMSVIDIANATLIIFTLQIFTQVIVAYLSDKTVSQYGRRKPYVLIGNVIRFICFIFLAFPPDHSPTTLFGWYATFCGLVNIGVSIVANPFYSWMIESSVNDEDFTRLFSISVPFGGVFGAIVGLGLVILSPALAVAVSLIGGSITTGLLLYFIPAKSYRVAKPLPKMIPSIRICFQTAEFRKIFYTAVSVSAGQSILGVMGFYLYYIGFHLQNQSFVITCALVTAVISGLMGMVFIIACNWILKYVEKVKLYTMILSAIFVLLIGLFFTTLNDAGFYPNLFITGVIGTCAMPIGLLGSLFTRDLVIYDTFATGYKRENMYISALSIPTSIVSQFLAGIPVVILSLSGFTANSTNGDDDSISNAYSWNVYCVWIIRISSTFVVSMFIFVAYYVLRDYGLNTQVAEQMNKVNQRREDKSDADDNEAAETRKTEAKGTDSAALEAANIEVDLSEAALMAIRETEVDGEIIQVTDDERQLLLHFSVAELYRIYAAIDSSVYKSSQGLPLIQTLLAFGCVEAFLTELVLVVAIALDNKNFGNSFSTLLIYFLVLVAFYILYEASRYVAIARVSKWKPHDLKLRAKAVYLEFSRKADTLQHLLAKEGINPDGSVDVDMISQWAGLRPSSLLGKNADEKELEEEAFVNLSGYKRIFSAIGAIAIFCIALIVIGNAK